MLECYPQKIKKNDKNGNTLLHLAAELGNYQLTKHLLELSENPHFKNNFKETPIFEEKIIKTLLFSLLNMDLI